MSWTYLKRWRVDNGWHLEEWLLHPDGRAQCWHDYIPVPVREAK